MSQGIIANGYIAAAILVNRAACQTATIDAIYEKNNRILKYLKTQAAAELAGSLV
jgi:hypothetical protein